MRINRTVTVTAAGPINCVTGLNATQMANYGRLAPVWVRSFFVQMLAGGAGYGTVLPGIYGVQADGISPRIPSGLGATSGDLGAQLGASPSATQPGGSYGDPDVLPNGASSIDVSRYWVDGSNAGDTIVISYDTTENIL
jgi:hypothetical protein